MTDANVADRVEDEVRARLKAIDGQAARCLCTGADGEDKTGWVCKRRTRRQDEVAERGRCFFVRHFTLSKKGGQSPPNEMGMLKVRSCDSIGLDGQMRVLS